MAEHNITELDEFVASVKPTKKQFKYLTLMLEKEFTIRQKYHQIVKVLLQAKTMIQEVCVEMYSVSNISLRSDMFSGT